MWDFVGTASSNRMRGGKVFLAWVAGFLCGVVFSAPVHAASADDLLGQPAPDFALKSMSGKNLRLSEYRGEIVLVNFWASWCGACREQMDALSSLHTQYQDQGLNVLSVSIDRKSKRAEKFLANLRTEFPVLLDERKSVSRIYDLDDMPLTMLVDQAGVVRAVHEGFNNDDEQLYQTEIAALLAE